jgi:hypothetical protein
VPWCDDCERFANPNSLSEQGGCPTCGTVIAEAPEPGPEAATAVSSVPWHFWFLLAALVLYLGWSLIQGVGWLAGRL